MLGAPAPTQPSREGAAGARLPGGGRGRSGRPSLGCRSIAISLETMGKEGSVNRCLVRLAAVLGRGQLRAGSEGR